MEENRRKFVLLNLALALVVIAVFGLAPPSGDNRHAVPVLVEAESNVASDSVARMSTAQ